MSDAEFAESCRLADELNRRVEAGECEHLYPVDSFTIDRDSGAVTSLTLRADPPTVTVTERRTVANLKPKPVRHREHAFRRASRRTATRRSTRRTAIAHGPPGRPSADDGDEPPSSAYLRVVPLAEFRQAVDTWLRGGT